MNAERVPTQPLNRLVGYFALAYAITWGSILAYVGSTGFRLDAMSVDDVPAVGLCMLLGPSLSGLLFTALFDGRAGLGDLVRRVRRWRAPASIWAVALFTNPVTFVAILGLLAATVSSTYTPGFEPSFLLVGLLAGAIEEIGWTGYATPRLLARTSPIRAGIVLGLLWATWHAAADFAINGATMELTWLPYFLVYWVATLTAYRVLMTWVFARTGSLLVAMVMHGSYTGWQGVFTPATSTTESFIWQALLAVSMTLVVAFIVRRRRTAVAVRSVEGVVAAS